MNGNSTSRIFGFADIGARIKRMVMRGDEHIAEEIENAGRGKAKGTENAGK